MPDLPASNPDLKNRVDILTTIRKVVRDHKIADIMTMHDLNQALRFADTFIFIKNGTVYNHGNHDIVTPSVIGDVYGLPVMMGEPGGVRCVIPGA